MLKLTIRSIMDGNCSDYAVGLFSKHVRLQLLRVDVLLVLHTVLMVVMVGIGAYGHRYRHHPLTRYLFLGVTMSFLPIVSHIVSTISNQHAIAIRFMWKLEEEETISMVCETDFDTVLVWSGLVQIVGINTAVIVAADAREARDIAPPVVLVVEAIWVSYLMAQQWGDLDFDGRLYLLVPSALIFAKLFLKYYSWYEARKSLALGRNPRLIVGYMGQIQDRIQHAEPASEHIPPALIVTGEDTESVEKQPHGYSFKGISNGRDGTRINKNGLVTLEKAWQICDMLPSSIAHHLQDVCFSFSLFKLLRCRFARYTIADAAFMKAHNFLRHILLEKRDDERVLGVIAYELTFLHDYYYSALAVSYSKSWPPVLSIFISLLSTCYCLFWIVRFIVGELVDDFRQGFSVIPQLVCVNKCNTEGNQKTKFGSELFELLPVCSLLALVLLTEVREIASYICSNWTKVSLIRLYTNHASWQQSPAMKKWVGHLLKCKCEMLKHWEDKMNLCSIIVLHPRKIPLAPLCGLIPVPDKKKKIPREVKVAIVQSLRKHVRAGNNGMITSLCKSPQLQVGDNLLWTFNGANGTANIMLVCHIATSILEVRSDPQLPPSDHKIIATHLSRYCAYLVAHCPELLPDFERWCKSMYKAVKKEAELILVSAIRPEATPQVKYQKLFEQLSTRSEHEVLKNGAELGRLLVELPEGEEKAWELLAGFWAEMLMYVAPSDNLNGHAEAIARGGELITLLWALLGHLGCVSRPDDDAAAATAC
ncbi:hypothetical protein VPH35_025240 [Triticum aestivum]